MLTTYAEAAHRDQQCRDVDARGAVGQGCDAALDAWDRAFLHVAQLQAATMEGMRAKAAVLQMALRREHELVAVCGPNDTFEPGPSLSSTTAARTCI